MVVDPGEAQVFERRLAQKLKKRRAPPQASAVAGLHIVEKGADVGAGS